MSKVKKVTNQKIISKNYSFSILHQNHNDMFFSSRQSSYKVFYPNTIIKFLRAFSSVNCNGKKKNEGLVTLFRHEYGSMVLKLFN